MSLQDPVNKPQLEPHEEEPGEHRRIIQPQISDFDPSRVDSRHVDEMTRFAAEKEYGWSDTLIARQAALMEHGPKSEYSHGQHEIDVGDRVKRILNLLADRQAGIWTVIAATRSRIIAEGADLHDIGKAGPPGSDPAPFVHFYNFNVMPSNGKKTFDTSFKEALNNAMEEGAIENWEAKYILHVLKLCGLDPDTMSLRDFYNLHPIFGGMILDGEDIDDDLKRIVPSHHMGRRGDKLNAFKAPESLMPESAIIEVVDAGVAMYGRPNNPASKRSAGENMEILERPYNTEISATAPQILCADFIKTLREKSLWKFLFHPRGEID